MVACRCLATYLLLCQRLSLVACWFPGTNSTKYFAIIVVYYVETNIIIIAFSLPFCYAKADTNSTTKHFAIVAYADTNSTKYFATVVYYAETNIIAFSLPCFCNANDDTNSTKYFTIVVYYAENNNIIAFSLPCSYYANTFPLH